MRVTLLGTGCPIADLRRYGPATLIESGPETWLVDCGSGVTQRLLGHGTNSAAITGLLLTHLHSDHTIDFMQLLISGWHQNRAGPLRVYGPRRTQEFFGDLLAAWEPEFKQRSAHELRTRDGLTVTIEEIDGHWSQHTQHTIITNTEVYHQPIPQAFGYRFDAQGASAVVSGDTTYCPELVDMAIGCDLLVHEAYVHFEMEAQRTDRPPEARANLLAYHSTPEQAGDVAEGSGAGALALTHWVPSRFDRERVTAEVRTKYAGPLYLGEDLMCFDVQRGQVTLEEEGKL